MMKNKLFSWTASEEKIIKEIIIKIKKLLKVYRLIVGPDISILKPNKGFYILMITTGKSGHLPRVPFRTLAMELPELLKIEKRYITATTGMISINLITLLTKDHDPDAEKKWYSDRSKQAYQRGKARPFLETENADEKTDLNADLGKSRNVKKTSRAREKSKKALGEEDFAKLVARNVLPVIPMAEREEVIFFVPTKEGVKIGIEDNPFLFKAVMQRLNERGFKFSFIFEQEKIIVKQADNLVHLIKKQKK